MSYQKTLEEGLEAVDELDLCECNNSTNGKLQTDIIKSFLTSFAEEIRESVVEEVEGKILILREDWENYNDYEKIIRLAKIETLEDVLAQLKVK